MFSRILILIASLGIAAELAASAPQISKRGYLELNKANEVAELEAASDKVGSQAVPDGCISGDLDGLLEPSDALTGTLVAFGETASASIWREACQGDPSSSAVVLRITPDTERAFVCSAAFTAIQDAVQYNAVKLVTVAGGDPFCDDLSQMDTFLLDQFKIEGAVFDEDQVFDLSYNSLFVARVPAYEQAGVPGPGDRFELLLEEPVDGATASGVSNVRGWAIASQGIESIELFVDGTSIGELPYGGLRDDVEGVFPGVPNSRESGFSASFNYGSLESGEHTMTARAKTSNGQEQDSTSTFTVEAFPDDFIDDPGFPSFSQATTQIQGTDGTVTLSPVTLLDGSAYSLQLRWSTATQGFEIVSVTPIN